jgi:hypothetical protein
MNRSQDSYWSKLGPASGAGDQTRSAQRVAFERFAAITETMIKTRVAFEHLVTNPINDDQDPRAWHGKVNATRPLNTQAITSISWPL